VRWSPWQGTHRLELLLDDLKRRRVHRVPRTAVFMTSAPGGAPLALLH
jgi:K+ transporter